MKLIVFDTLFPASHDYEALWSAEHKVSVSHT